jgi:hypothetical protein
VSQPDRQLEGNTQYLKAALDAANLGQALYLRDQLVSSVVKIGQPVYWNYTNSRFEPAMAAVENNDLGVLIASDSADVAGIVYSKSAATIATLLTVGTATVDLTEAVDGTPVAGRYYLSAADAGMLVAQSPPATVLVLRNLGDGRVMLDRANRIFAQDHQHISIALAVRPAGNCAVVGVGEVHTIISPDTAIRGWLPADHASFGGLAPAGAKFGYNMDAHAVLAAVWPPIPIAAVLLEMMRSDGVNGQQQVYGRVTSDLVQFDTNGIWWMSDCYNEAPWPVDCSTTSSLSSLSACPTSIDMSLILSFVRMTFHTG